jgi:hypothetical protein
MDGILNMTVETAQNLKTIFYKKEFWIFQYCELWFGTISNSVTTRCIAERFVESSLNFAFAYMRPER